MKQPHFLTNTTPFPNALLDKAMPALKDTEWRVLCAVVRHTLGWQDTASASGRKERAWLTQQRLKKVTNRESSAVSGAIDALVKQGFLLVTDRAGKPQWTPKQRQSCRSQLYFRLPDAGPGGLWMKRSKSESAGAQTSSQGPQSGVRKAGTIERKERINTAYAGEREDSSFSFKGNDQTQPEGDQVKKFIASYVETFKQHTASGDPPPIVWGKDAQIVSHLLAIYPSERLAELLGQFFGSNDPWIRRLGYSLGAFRASISKLLINEQTTTTYRRDTRTGGWVKEREERMS